jgi:hypothetical protein
LYNVTGGGVRVPRAEAVSDESFSTRPVFHSIGVVLFYYGITGLVAGMALSVVFQVAHSASPSAATTGEGRSCRAPGERSDFILGKCGK